MITLNIYHTFLWKTFILVLNDESQSFPLFFGGKDYASIEIDKQNSIYQKKMFLNR